jgi:hypothetical protein
MLTFLDLIKLFVYLLNVNTVDARVREALQFSTFFDELESFLGCCIFGYALVNLMHACARIKKGRLR